jgi:hypothetical protein
MKRKPLRITRAYFRVSANRYAQNGYFADFRIFAVMPTARTEKPHMVHITSYAGYIHAKPLFDHAGEASITPADWRALVNRAPVQSDPLDGDGQVTITPEIIAQVRADALKWADSAERQLSESHPDWQTNVASKYDQMTFGEETL